MERSIESKRLERKGHMEKNMVMSNNEFVRKEQAKMRAKMGDRPVLKAEAHQFNAYMCNDGEDAQAYARKVGLDDAYPVK